MKIVVWNMNGGVQAKLNHLRSLNPDVAVVPECARDIEVPDGSMVWCGAGAAKGLADFAFGDWRLEQVDTDMSKSTWAMPVRVKGPVEFHLLAVWADTDVPRLKGREGDGAIGPLRQGLRTNRRFLRSAPSVVAGDFNHNSRWDEPFVEYSHSYGVADLRTLGLTSAYHRHHRVEQGSEPDPTFWTSKDPAKPHHLDYCFVPQTWSVDSVEAAPRERFCKLVADGGVSDHAPLEVAVSPGS